MKHKKVESFLKKHVLPELPGWDCQGRLLFKAPIGFIYIGFELDPSQWDKELVSNIYFQYRATGMEEKDYLSARTHIHVDRPHPELYDWRLAEGDEPGFARDFLIAVRQILLRVEPILASPHTALERHDELERACDRGWTFWR